MIQEIVGEKVRVIDPAPAVARQVERSFEAGGKKSQMSAREKIQLITSGNPAALQSLLPKLLREGGEIIRADWLNDTKITTPTRA
ncbi:MAG: hypothetical protein U0X92_00580 [Anaerolineales bacterium]